MGKSECSTKIVKKEGNNLNFSRGFKSWPRGKLHGAVTWEHCRGKLQHHVANFAPGRPLG